MPVRILFLLEDLCFGGTQHQMLELARRLNRTKFEPILATLTGVTDWDDLALQARLPLYHLGKSRKVAPIFFARLAPLLHRIKPDLLLPCTALPNIWGRFWGKLFHIPVIGTCRGGGGPKRQHERLLWRWTAKLICNSGALLDKLLNLGIPKEHLIYIPNGVDVGFFKPSKCQRKENKEVILCLARLCEDKDHLTLLRAFAYLFAKRPQVELHLVGDGPQKTVLQEWVNQHTEISQHIKFFPGTSDVLPHYLSADLFALSSLREGQPNVLLEALSCALPVCATNVGGIPALVRKGEMGLLSEAGDWRTLAENCLTLLENKEQRLTMGVKGRAWVEKNFSFSAMVNAHEAVFLEIMEKFAKKVR